MRVCIYIYIYIYYIYINIYVFVYVSSFLLCKTTHISGNIFVLIRHYKLASIYSYNRVFLQIIWTLSLFSHSTQALQTCWAPPRGTRQTRSQFSSKTWLDMNYMWVSSLGGVFWSYFFTRRSPIHHPAGRWQCFAGREGGSGCFEGHPCSLCREEPAGQSCQDYQDSCCQGSCWAKGQSGGKEACQWQAGGRLVCHRWWEIVAAATDNLVASWFWWWFLWNLGFSVLSTRKHQRRSIGKIALGVWCCGLLVCCLCQRFGRFGLLAIAVWPLMSSLMQCFLSLWFVPAVWPLGSSCYSGVATHV